VRELANVIERSVILCESDTLMLDAGWRPSEPAPRDASCPSRAPTLDEIQRDAIVRALQSCNGILGGPRGAASLLGIKRTTLQARMHKLGISSPTQGVLR
jgi:formate hydrogenlyase transcriptional activator